MGKAKQFRLPSQSRGHAAAQLKTDLVCKLVTHPDKLAEGAVEVNAAARAGINDNQMNRSAREETMVVSMLQFCGTAVEVVA